MIGFNLTEEQKEMQAFFRKFHRTCDELQRRWMKKRKWIWICIHEMQSLGMFAFHSEEVGSGVDLMFSTMFFNGRTFKSYSASTSITVSVHTSFYVHPALKNFATPEQKEMASSTG